MRLKVSAVQFKKTNTASATDNANSSLTYASIQHTIHCIHQKLDMCH
jgi:hypothetical protein